MWNRQSFATGHNQAERLEWLSPHKRLKLLDVHTVTVLRAGIRVNPVGGSVSYADKGFYGAVAGRHGLE